MKVKILNLQNAPKLQVVKVIKELTNQSLKETKDQVDAAVASGKNSMEFETLWTLSKDYIKGTFDRWGLNYCFLDECPQHERVEPQLQKEEKLQEVTIDDLGASIHSIDEETIGWQCKMLFTHEQATRILSSLHDAKLNITEALVMYKGDKTTMLIIAKNFPSGIKVDDLDAFECLIYRLVENICRVVEIDHTLEGLQEQVAEAFEELDEYE